MRAYLTEFIGTFFLVFTIGMATQANLVSAQTGLPPIAIGSMLMVMVYMGGHISGAHYNPAVSLAMLIRGKLSLADFVPYIIAQLVGAFAAAAVVYFIHGEAFGPAPAKGVSDIKAVLVEALYTFALALVVLNVATSKKTTNNSYYGLAIGFTVMAAAFAGGSVSGGAFNPAVGIGPLVFKSLMGGTGIEFLWIYIVGPLIGGALAAMVFKIQEE